MSETAEWLRFTPAQFAQVVCYLVAIVLAYAKLDKRITALETHQEAEAQRLERIENKVDRLLERDR